ncbi:TAF5-like protein [Pleurostoma richardsiae]|uniref:TAF5-like protein n=1 Tax=Pleurostoma richardsiae TaxID=41990 RepID=A0AA38VJN6_9PEZI|nr:TAF5-like protein [Pleurostoma richardsiae]
MSGPAPQSAGGASSGGYGGQAQHGGAGGAAAGGGGGTGTAASAAPPPSAQNLNQIVTDYLLKRGFTQTEEIFRKESANLGPDGRPIHTKVEEMGARKFGEAFILLRDWIENGLDVYKFELRKLLWPVFVYSFLELVERRYPDEAKAFLNKFTPVFEKIHGDDLRTFATISLPQHIAENNTTKLYRENKYRIPLNLHVERSLFHFIDRETDRGGSLISWILSSFCQIDKTARGPIDPYSFEALYRRTQNADLDEVDLQEGIPGVFTGVTNKDILDAPLKLGPLPMEQELREDVRAELEEEDQRHPPTDGRPTLVEEFDQKIKREDSPDVPSRADLPLPPSRARDVVMEMQKVRENRDRFKIEGRTGGVGVPVSVCIFTFHNTLGSVSSMDFSKDHELVAIGTMDSYIRVFSLDGKPLKSKLSTEKDIKVNNRKLIGHSGPVYGLSFSDAISSANAVGGDDASQVETGPKLLLSSSADGHIRLWSLDVWSCLCIYKAHDGPVFRVLWSPHGHYFASAGWDKTVRIFMQDHASAQRICVGHDTSISAITWHPNGTYVFSASDETDKSIRMWSVVTGQCVRVFTGHTEYISALECAPNGKMLASADIGGNIFFWDIAKGTRIKRCRGHGKGGIPSLSFSVESTVLVSGGVDGTVRLWDVELPADANKTGLSGASMTGAQPPQDGGNAASDSVTVGGQAGPTITVGGQGAQQSTSTAAGSGAGGTGKKKTKEVMVTPDQISAFPTKKTPVMKVQFTRMNLVVAGGCYDPER